MSINHAQAPSPAATYGGPADPYRPTTHKRPGSVLAGCLMTWIASGLTIPGAAILIGAILRARETDAVTNGMSVADSRVITTWQSALVLACCVAAIVFAVLAFRRKKLGALGLVATGGIWLLASLIASVLQWPIMGVGGLIGVLIGGLYIAGACFLVYATRSARTWFAGATQA